MRSVALVGILLSTTILGGCAGTIGGITFSSISSFAGFASTLFTGADLGEHAASLITGKDCRFSEGLMRADRDVCEEPGSLATRDDFHGIFVDRIEADGTVVYAAPKYMPASFGAGEYDNKPDEIWAAIKTQKFAEAQERELARAENATQTIDVAALATGSVSSESLAFLPAGTKSDADLIDGDTASLTASRPRTVANTATVAPMPVEASPKAPAASAPEAVSIPLDMSQPAIDEKTFAASVQTKQTGEGGPFIATAASSTPVASTLINGEPVVVLRLRPIFSANSAPATAVTSAMPVATTEIAAAPEPATFTTPLSPKADAAPSPLAILDQAPARAELPSQTVASIEPQMEPARPRVKPAAAPIVEEPAKAKPVRATAPAPTVARQRKIERDAADVYQPPARTGSTETAAFHAPVQTPVDVPTEPAPAVAPMSSTSGASSTTTTSAPMEPISEPVAAAPTPVSATGGPAPLVPMPQE